MKVLIFGSGAMAGYMAGRLSRGGTDIVVSTSDKHLPGLASEGFCLRDASSGEMFSEKVEIVGADRIEIVSGIDLILVAVKAHQVESLLPVLKASPPSLPIVFIGSYIFGPSDWADTLGRGRTFFAFPGSAAVRDENGVIDFIDRGDGGQEIWGLTMGGLHPDDGTEEAGGSLDQIESFFREAGLPIYRNEQMEAVFLSQAAIRLPILAAVKMAGGSLDTLYVRGDLLKLMIKGIRESLSIVKSRGYPFMPPSLSMYRLVPVFISANMIKHKFDTPSSRIGIERFAASAGKETAFLADQLLQMAGEGSANRDHLVYLFSVFDADGEEGAPEH